LIYVGFFSQQQLSLINRHSFTCYEFYTVQLNFLQRESIPVTGTNNKHLWPLDRYLYKCCKTNCSSLLHSWNPVYNQ